MAAFIPSPLSPSRPIPSLQTFPYPNLPTDMQIVVLSFLAEAPFEKYDEHLPIRQGTLTHVIPFVCKLWADYSKSKILWDVCIDRKRSSPNCPSFGATFDSLFQAFASVPKYAKPNLRAIAAFAEAERDIRFNLPCFFMPSYMRLMIPIQLHLFEPRYCLLISRVMRGRAADGRELGSEGQPCPRFVYLDQYTVTEGSTGFVCEVRRCVIYETGRADVVLLPIKHCVCENCAVEDGSGGLHYVKGREIFLNKTTGSGQPVVVGGYSD